MNNYEFSCRTRIVFGADVEDRAGEYVKRCGGKRILLHYGGESAKKSGLLDKVKKSLEENGLYYAELGGVKPNPRLALVREGIRLAKEESLDFVLAVGGGSVIDSGKGIAAGVMTEDDIWGYYMDMTRGLKEALPVGVVLTIPAAGSESSNGSVLTDEETGFKRHIASEAVVPEFALLDPKLTYTLPPWQIACGCSDILAHLMERYFSRTPHTDLTDRLLEAAMQTVMKYGPLALAHPEDYDIRAEIMQVGQISHSDSLDGGRQTDWASHEIEHELSGQYDIAHGAGLAVIFPAWMRYVCHAGPEKFMQFGRRVLGMDFSAGDTEHGIERIICALEDWYRGMGLPVRLSELGIGDDRFDKMAEMCLVERDHVGNFVELHEEDVKKIYELAK
ncbi:MAG: NADH-dependent alcohol dehydrogenase [Clostridiales bacterium]|nr:MAG: NADH-dependent alcohol dehydrogenase [Clostridiales bacterium]